MLSPSSPQWETLSTSGIVNCLLCKVKVVFKYLILPVLIMRLLAIVHLLAILVLQMDYLLVNGGINLMLLPDKEAINSNSQNLN